MLLAQAYRPAKNITLTSGGGTYSISSSNYVENFLIKGSATLTSSWTIEPTGTYLYGTEVKLLYAADMVLNGNSITIFGATLNEAQAQNNAVIKCLYNGSAWDVSITNNAIDLIYVSGDLLIVGTDTFSVQGTAAWTTNVNTVRLQDLTDSVAIGKATAEYTFDIVGNMQMEHTDTTTYEGVIYKNGIRFIHDFAPDDAQGKNVFIGYETGNFTMRRDISKTSPPYANQCSWNIGIGDNAMKNIITAAENIAAGELAMADAYNASNCIGIGYTALWKSDSSVNVVSIGNNARRLDKYARYCFDGGVYAGYNTTNAYRQTNLGAYAGYRHSGQKSVLLGSYSGYHLSFSTTGSEWILIGDSVIVPAGLAATDSLININDFIYNYTGAGKTDLTINSYSDTVRINDGLVANSLKANTTIATSCRNDVTGDAGINITCDNIVLTGDYPADSILVASINFDNAIIVVEALNHGSTGGLKDGNNIIIAGDWVGKNDGSIIVLQRRGNNFYELSRSDN